MSLLHGGQLARVAAQYQINEQHWLDLSTGIAPFSYPIPAINAQAWQDLPTISAELLDAAQQYYHSEHCWPLAGSQQLIERLPQMWVDKCGTAIEKHVYLPEVGYKEHQRAWQDGGYRVHCYQAQLPQQIQAHAVVVVINPNNPTQDCFTLAALQQLSDLCHAQKGLLVIDEAFADIFAPEFSFTGQLASCHEDVIVLRSFGKFFGLAGIRIGFVCSSANWCALIKERNGPWSVNGPALYIAQQALRDRQWQQQQRRRLTTQSERQTTLLRACFPGGDIKGNALFITLFTPQAVQIYDLLCRHGVYVRLTDEQHALRFGIADEAQLTRLTQILAALPLETL